MWIKAFQGAILLFIFQTRIPRGEGCDSLCWHLNGSVKFDIPAFYHKIRNATLSTFPWKFMWKVKVPKRVVFFMWTTAYDLILILDNFMFRSRLLLNYCCMCCCNEESVDHLLIFCPVAHSLWMYML